jgi:deazaflavin-dependent oxidoreductase (nitroreductase family)
VKPLIYGVIAGEVVIVASRGGADHHPQWYLNIRENSTVDVQIGTQAFRATWREPEAAERERVWDFVVGLYPPYAGYQESTLLKVVAAQRSRISQPPWNSCTVALTSGWLAHTVAARCSSTARSNR